ncbi:hypothetical protein C6B38_04380 [Spiroplasma sp. ChiS]|uniref:hypothetical protein n=1 Tax=Spiroplasma sp. ChiS TaxID=2099885 RepID=UPI000CF84C3D|nr:hypothetical protein [Spiroplasma sp. ChiS]PQP78708.1 hypothetical protein C6B38_04380 [Spiroplasma sp. ChiS]
MDIDLAKINEPDFLKKFDTVLNRIVENVKNTLKFDISGYLNKDISFDQTLVGKGTVKDLLHNMAPDLIALLQWFIREGKEKIESTHNTVLPLIQYLFSTVNEHN